MFTTFRNGVKVKIYRGNPLVGPHGCIYQRASKTPLATTNAAKVAIAVVTEWVLANEIGLDIYKDLIPAVKYKENGDTLRAYLLENEIIQFGQTKLTSYSETSKYSFSFVSLISNNNPWSKSTLEEPSVVITTDHLVTVSEDK